MPDVTWWELLAAVVGAALSWFTKNFIDRRNDK